MNKYIDNIKAIGLHTEDGHEYYDKDDCYYNDVLSAIWCGVFGFCGCGDRKYELNLIWETLTIIKEKDLRGMGKLYKLENGFQIYLYLLDWHGFTEHGSSVFGSWLTPKGEALLEILNKKAYLLEE